ncbi:MAG: hypothetical protein ACI9N0_002774 [Ilumatobacter sp.]|jgi:hypothetical protein
MTVRTDYSSKSCSIDCNSRSIADWRRCQRTNRTSNTHATNTTTDTTDKITDQVKISCAMFMLPPLPVTTGSVQRP